jgi:hypothetical protein
MASNLSSSHLRKESDLKKMRQLLGW